ncbi:hypothetical protein SAMN05421647_1176 [Marinobacterium stanieri]|uniref:Uncharacterized protein n=1 Tax=Marinobacterium stanieri TaxID=49186 RepID=A0A1N6XV46_9GAMM|nr:hypothetical protein SAMN05421647_1176 [Marinobacterium stanieri]
MIFNGLYRFRLLKRIKSILLNMSNCRENTFDCWLVYSAANISDVNVFISAQYDNAIHQNIALK